ncbi:MAG: T9SS type A sorting domain-containing protein [Candidatus Edwardsbacteria bacterium]
MNSFTATPLSLEDKVGVELGIGLDVGLENPRAGVIDIDRRNSSSTYSNQGQWTDVVVIPTSWSAVPQTYHYTDKNVEQGKGYDYRAIYNSDTLTTSCFLPFSVPFAVWPNPTRSLREIKFSRRGKYKIYNGNGQLVGKTDGKSPLPYVSNGCYFIKEEDSNRNIKKIVVVK